MSDSEFDELKKRTLLRQRRKANLVEHETAIKKLMEMNVSLPVVLEWLIEKKNITTTLPALRRFVRRSFGESFYDEFAARNGWQKKKLKKILSSVRIPDRTQIQKKEQFSSKGGVTQEQLKASLREKIDINGLEE
jgi:hypothetical protein